MITALKMSSKVTACGSVVAAIVFAMPVKADNKTAYDLFNEITAQSPVVPHSVRGNIKMLTGAGGNIAVLSSVDGHFLVDPGIASARDRILEQLNKISSGPVKFAVTTHWHWDHAEGNSWARELGATAIAHEGAVRRLRQTIRVPEWGHTFTPTPDKALPNLVINKPKTISFGGEKILVRPYGGPGHTDGDLSVYFTSANVLVTGDTFWKDQYPFLDYVGGGGINSAITAADRNIAMTDARTLVIPGHGDIADRSDLIAFRDMLVGLRDEVARLKKQGMSLEEVLIANPTSKYDVAWGRGIVDPKQFVSLVYRGV